VFQRALHSLAAWRDAMRAAASVGRADKLMAQDRLPEAFELLKHLRDRAQPPGDGVLRAEHDSTRLIVAKMLSVVAAKTGDRQAAVQSISEGLPLWRDIEPTLRSEETRASLKAWETWAVRYLERSEGP